MKASVKHGERYRPRKPRDPCLERNAEMHEGKRVHRRLSWGLGFGFYGGADENKSLFLYLATPAKQMSIISEGKVWCGVCVECVIVVLFLLAGGCFSDLSQTAAATLERPGRHLCCPKTVTKRLDGGSVCGTKCRLIPFFRCNPMQMLEFICVAFKP